MSQRSDASRCRATAAGYARAAALADDCDARRAYGELERLWSEMAALAERFDRAQDGEAKAQIYAKMAEVEAVRRAVV